MLALRAVLIGIILLFLIPLTPSSAKAEEGALEFFREHLTVEADIEIGHESQGSETSTEATFDEVGFALEGYGWEVEAGIKYESEESRLRLEEAAVQVGLTDEWPWFVRFGRTVLPFGEFESRFIEDPLTVVVGETDDDGVVVGIEGVDAVLAIAAFPSEFDSDSDFDFVTSITTEAFDDLAVGVSLATDLGESVELREFRRDWRRSRDLPTDLGSAAEVRGVAGFAAYDLDRYLLQFGYVSALKSFPTQVLADGRLRPSAFNLEAAYRPADRWELAVRAEGSEDLPMNPEWQFGIGSSYLVRDQIRVAGEYLRGLFKGESDRDLLGFVVSLTL